jgi:membrane protease YdiL (CAAX protease family)
MDGAVWVLAFGAIIGFQALRNHLPEHWMLLDNAQRLSALAILALSPRLRPNLIPDQRPWFRPSDGLIIVLLFAVTFAGFRWLSPLAAELLGPGVGYSFPPYADGVERLVDLCWGIFLVAVEEEVVFTAVLTRLLRSVLGPGATLVVASVVFAANHWSLSWGTIVTAGATHLAFLAAYLWRGRLAPCIAAHWLYDVWDFG